VKKKKKKKMNHMKVILKHMIKRNLVKRVGLKVIIMVRMIVIMIWKRNQLKIIKEDGGH